MCFKNQYRRIKNARSLKKYWLKFCYFIGIPLSIIVVALSWKFESDLACVKELRETRMKTIEQMMTARPYAAKERTSDTWGIADAKDAAIFSAYLDSRPEVVLEETFYSNDEYSWALIRIIAILEVDSASSELACYYKFPAHDDDDDAPGNRSTILERPAIGARLIASSENFDMRYSAAFVLCKLIMSDDGRLPTDVTFSANKGQSEEEARRLNFVGIRYPKASSASTNDDDDNFMAACVPSLHHNYANYENLVEFVEFYRSMGVNHFTFYNSSVGDKVSRVLDYYAQRNLATVIQWKLPPVYKFERNLRYNGIFAALNDCLYRNTMAGGYTYVVNVDLDEFIVPRKHDNFRQLMSHLDSESEHSDKAAFIFRNVFFYLMYDDDPSVDNKTDKPKLLLQSKTTRYEEIYEAYSRSKYIARGENVVEMGNHRVWRSRRSSYLFSNGVETANPDVALLHHYRLCEVNELVCWLRETIVDTAAHKYTEALEPKVAAVLARVFDESRTKSD